MSVESIALEFEFVLSAGAEFQRNPELLSSDWFSTANSADTAPRMHLVQLYNTKINHKEDIAQVAAPRGHGWHSWRGKEHWEDHAG